MARPGHKCPDKAVPGCCINTITITSLGVAQHAGLLLLHLKCSVLCEHLGSYVSLRTGRSGRQAQAVTRRWATWGSAPTGDLAYQSSPPMSLLAGPRWQTGRESCRAATTR